MIYKFQRLQIFRILFLTETFDLQKLIRVEFGIDRTMCGSVIGDDVDEAKLETVGALVIDRDADGNVLFSVDLFESFKKSIN